MGQGGEVPWHRCGGGTASLPGSSRPGCGAGPSPTPNSTVYQLLSRGPVPRIQFSAVQASFPINLY